MGTRPIKPKLSTRLAGHELPGEGRLSAPGIPCWAPHRPRIGKATCTCGAKSPELTTDSARKRWHREHKDQIRAQQTA